MSDVWYTLFILHQSYRLNVFKIIQYTEMLWHKTYKHNTKIFVGPMFFMFWRLVFNSSLTCQSEDTSVGKVEKLNYK